MFESVNCSGAHPVCPALAVLSWSGSDTQAVAPGSAAKMTATVGNRLEVMVSVLRGGLGKASEKDAASNGEVEGPDAASGRTRVERSSSGALSGRKGDAGAHSLPRPRRQTRNASRTPPTIVRRPRSSLDWCLHTRHLSGTPMPVPTKSIARRAAPSRRGRRHSNAWILRVTPIPGLRYPFGLNS